MSRRQKGTVWVKLWVDEKGNVREATVLKSDAEILNQPSIDAAMKWKFEPAILKGQPVDVWVTIPFKFKLDAEKYEPKRDAEKHEPKSETKKK
jgi:TonB family protein